MSDDEMPEMPEGGMGMDDMSDDDMDYKGPNELPEGIQKELLKDGDGFKKPKAGDEVTVHYVGTLQSDGTEFDSSRGRDDPFVFTLGKGQVIKGWDLGVATMKKGELAKFTLASEFAYGESGSPPKIPENATLVFEVELLSWISKDDLFQDEGVIKTEVKEGKGWKKPKEGDEVLLTLKCTAKDGTVADEKTDFEYVLGSGACGPLSTVVDKALAGMKKEEEVELTCSSEYALGEKTPDGATVSLTLLQVYETKDVSSAKDKSLMKKAIVEGDGYDTPKDSAKVQLNVQETKAGSLPGFTAKTLDFTAGNGEVCDALEFAVGDMKKGEKAVVTCTAPQLCCEEQLGLSNISAEVVVLTLELVDFEKAKDTFNMSEDEKVEFGTARKEVGSNLFRKGRYILALGRYKKVGEMFNYVDNLEEGNKKKAKELKRICELNSASCYLKLKDYSEAKKNCNNVLKEDSQNAKALFRRAQADIGLNNFMDSMHDLKRLVEMDPKNMEARNLYKVAQAGQKQEDKKSKGLFANMCKALGKGPIPEPYKSKSVVPEDDEESGDEDAEMPEAADPPQDAAAEKKDEAAEAEVLTKTDA